VFSRLTFRHGVHPPEHKALTAAVPVRRLPFPKEVVLPVRQHAGKPATPIVTAGQRVERGDLVAEPDGWVSSPIHASASGEVLSVGLWPHPDGSHDTAIRIAVEPYSAQIPRPRLVPDWHGLEPNALVEAVRHAGVVGLGGAAFPTHVKLSPPADTPVSLLLINGCECEPYLTTDHRSMVEYPERVHLGIRIMMRCLGVTRAIVGVERNKPDAIARLDATRPDDLDVTIQPLDVKYPQGAEKMLIEAVTGEEVPSGRLPAHVGVLVQNAASVATIAEVFETGLPLVERIVTVTGLGVRHPANLIVPVGTKLGDLIAACGGLTEDAREIVFGGPMMGASQANLETPLVKGTTGVVVLAESECRTQASTPCIRCGRCLDACPVFLNPQHLGKLAAAGRYDEMSTYHLADCMVCGCCSYGCPANIPLSQQFQAAKVALRQRKAVA
jgi:electron transport complex protein RnfC